MATDGDERSWDAGWEGHSLAQLRRMARLPLWEKLAWLEEAQRLARQLGGKPGQRPPTSGDGPAPPTAG